MTAAYVCPRGHRHYEGSAFCTVCGAGPVLTDEGGGVAARRPWFDYGTDQRPRLDRFRDPKGWLLDALPWPLRRIVLARRMRSWPPDGARYIGLRRPPWEAFDRGRELARKHGW